MSVFTKRESLMIFGDGANLNRLIRRATQYDMDALLDICHNSFPDSLRWQSPRSLGRKWWDATLTSRSSETWVCLKNGEMAGFCVLITDEDEEAKDSRQRNGSFLDKLFSVVTHPKLAFFKIWKKIKAAIAIASNHSKPKAAHSRIDENPVWLGLIAVSPRIRGQGLAKQMLYFCGDRTFQLNRHVMKLRVDPENKPARSLYERAGFVCTSQTFTDCIYTKAWSSRTR